MAVDSGESWQSKAEGAEPGAQPKEAGLGARWPSTAGKMQQSEAEPGTCET